MSIDVSIIVPTYRRPEKLDRALRSIQRACELKHEVIVVDDCPQASGHPIAKRFGAQYLWKAGRQRGLSRSRNLGIKLASGRYVAFLDDDDFFAPGGIDALHAALMGGFSLAYGNYSLLSASKATSTDLASVTLDRLLISNQIPVGAYLIESSAIRRDFDERMRSHEDWEFLLCNADWFRWRHVAHEVVTIDKTDDSESSMQQRRRPYFWLDFISVYARYPAPHLNGHRKNMLERLGVDIDEMKLGQADII